MMVRVVKSFADSYRGGADTLGQQWVQVVTLRLLAEMGDRLHPHNRPPHRRNCSASCAVRWGRRCCF